MSWLSLAANQFEIKNILEKNHEEFDSRTTMISSMFGRYALLSGENAQIEKEITIAETILSNYKNEARPPHPFVLSDVLDLAIIASLGKGDYFDIFESISDTEIYENKEEKTLQLLARRITGKESAPEKSYRKRGHIKKTTDWLKIVKDIKSSDAFDLAVTVEHPEFYLLEKFILPLGYLLAKSQDKTDWKNYFRRLISWGSANFEKSEKIIYKRISEKPEEIMKAEPNDKKTWRGFDAVELDKSEVIAYYYLGVKWEAPLFFQEEINVYSFLDGVKLDWKLVEENVSAEIWNNISEKIDKKQCKYIVVFDAANAYAPESALQRAIEHYGVEIVTKEITEI